MELLTDPNLIVSQKSKIQTMSLKSSLITEHNLEASYIQRFEKKLISLSLPILSCFIGIIETSGIMQCLIMYNIT